MSLQDIILTSIFRTVKKKPVLAVQILTGLFLTTIILIIINIIFNLNIYNYYNTYIPPVITGILMFTLAAYIYRWDKISYKIEKDFYKFFDNIIDENRDIINFLINDNTTYRLIKMYIDSLKSPKMIWNIFILLLNYYIILILILLSLDMMLFKTTNEKYSIFVYLTGNIPFALTLFLWSIILSQIVVPLSYYRTQHEQGEQRQLFNDLKLLLDNFFEKFLSIEQFDTETRKNNLLYSIFYNIIVAHSSILVPKSLLDRLREQVVVDSFTLNYNKLYYNKDKNDVSVLNKYLKGFYELEQLNKECDLKRETKPPIFRNACWFKVFKKNEGREGTENRLVGLLMIIHITGYNPEISINILKDCIGRIRKSRKVLRRLRYCCYGILLKVLEDYSSSHILFFFVIGNREIIGLKLLLNT